MFHKNSCDASIDTSIDNYYYRSIRLEVDAICHTTLTRMPNKLHTGESGTSTFSRLCDACTWRVSWSAIRSTRRVVHHSHQAQLVVGNKGSCHVPTPAALHCCLRRVAHQLCRVFSPAKTTCLVTCCPAGFIDRERTGSTHVLFFACACAALLVFHSCPRPSCLPAQLLTLTHLLISCHLPSSSSTIEQTLRLPSHDHRVDCPRPAMPQLPPSTRPEHQTPKPCVRKQNT
jgi:hypothetical protein